MTAAQEIAQLRAYQAQCNTEVDSPDWLGALLGWADAEWEIRVIEGRLGAMEPSRKSTRKRKPALDPRPGDVARYNRDAPTGTVTKRDGDAVWFEFRGSTVKCDLAWWKLFAQVIEKIAA